MSNIRIIAGKFKNRALITPKSIHVRPTTAQLREAVFNICQLSIQGAHFLDLFAGSGAMGFEALSRGAEHVTFVEKNGGALTSIKQNILLLGVEKEITLLNIEAFTALQKLTLEAEEFDIIYVDPPYGKGLGSEVLHYLDQHPLLRLQGTLFIEDSSLKEESHLQHLFLKSKRSMGRASLMEYHRH